MSDGKSETTDDRAHVCHFEKGGDQGGATFWFVRLPDGYLVGCGFSCLSKERADRIATLINAYGW